MTLPIADIKINRRSRQRRTIRNTDSLADSIQRNGLIQPIVLDRDHVLLAGERRLTAMKSLEWDTLIEGRHFIYIDEVDDYTRMSIELEENAKREELDWQDQAAAVAKYHELRKAAAKGPWSHDDTAKALGFSRQYISRILSVTDAAKTDPSIFEADKLSVAANTVERQRQRKAALAADELAFGGTYDVGYEEPAAETLSEQADPIIPLLDDSETIDLDAPTAPSPNHPPILLGDFLEWAQSYDGPPFNFLHLDLPYGIDFHTHARMNSQNQEKYIDTFENYKRLIEVGLAALPVSTEAHMMFWFSMKHYPYTRLALKDLGWNVHAHPLIWAMSDNSGLIPDPNREGRRVYETCFHCTRGDRKIVRPKANLYSGPRGETRHASEKSEPMLRHFFEMFVDSSTTLLDPTCGSGGALRVATALGAHRVLGIELNPDYHATACSLWNEAKEEVKL